MAKWPHLRLDKIMAMITDGDWIESKDQSPQGIRLLQVGNIGNGYYIEKSERAKYINEDTFKRLKCTEVLPGDILISRLPEPLGRACIVPLQDTKMITAVDCTIARVDGQKCDKQYLIHFLQSPQYFWQIGKYIAGSTRLRISKKNLQTIEIPLPSLPVQKQIADVLDRASTLIEKRKAQIAKLDLLVKSRFVEMFGDPVTNRHNWERGTIRDIVGEIKYGTSRAASKGGQYPYLRMNNITYDGQLDLSALKYIDIQDNELEKCIAHNGDVLFNRTNSKELVGKTCVFNIGEPMVVAGYIIRIRLNKRAVPEYLSGTLNSDYGKKTLRDMCKAIIGQANINAQELQDIIILIPPLDLQIQFVGFVQATDRIKSKLKQALAKMELNYKSLMQKCFRGEIF